MLHFPIFLRFPIFSDNPISRYSSPFIVSFYSFVSDLLTCTHISYCDPYLTFYDPTLCSKASDFATFRYVEQVTIQVSCLLFYPFDYPSFASVSMHTHRLYSYVKSVAT